MHDGTQGSTTRGAQLRRRLKPFTTATPRRGAGIGAGRALLAVLMALHAPIAFAFGIAAGALPFSLDEPDLDAGITRRPLDLAKALVGHMTGALAQMNVALATLMGFESGSGNADAAVQARMLGLEMVKCGYAPAFAAAIVAAPAVITPILAAGRHA